MDVDLASVVTAVSKNKSIKHLNMGRNMNNMKAKNIASVMDAVVQMIQVSCVILYLFMWWPGLHTHSVCPLKQFSHRGVYHSCVKIHCSEVCCTKFWAHILARIRCHILWFAQSHETNCRMAPQIGLQQFSSVSLFMLCLLIILSFNTEKLKLVWMSRLLIEGTIE